MKRNEIVDDKQLAVLAKKYRMAAGKTQAEAAREMGVKQPSMHHAEESPALPYRKLRRRLIEAYSPYRVVGPVYLLQKKSS